MAEGNSQPAEELDSILDEILENNPYDPLLDDELNEEDDMFGVEHDTNSNDASEEQEKEVSFARPPSTVVKSSVKNASPVQSAPMFSTRNTSNLITLTGPSSEASSEAGEDEDDEEEKNERHGKFRSERSTAPPVRRDNAPRAIPESLESVVVKVEHPPRKQTSSSRGTGNGNAGNARRGGSASNRSHSQQYLPQHVHTQGNSQVPLLPPSSFSGPRAPAITPKIHINPKFRNQLPHRLPGINDFRSNEQSSPIRPVNLIHRQPGNFTRLPQPQSQSFSLQRTNDVDSSVILNHAYPSQPDQFQASRNFEPTNFARRHEQPGAFNHTHFNPPQPHLSNSFPHHNTQHPPFLHNPQNQNSAILYRPQFPHQGHHQSVHEPYRPAGVPFQTQPRHNEPWQPFNRGQNHPQPPRPLNHAPPFHHQNRPPLPDHVALHFNDGRAQFNQQRSVYEAVPPPGHPLHQAHNFGPPAPLNNLNQGPPNQFFGPGPHQVQHFNHPQPGPSFPNPTPPSAPGPWFQRQPQREQPRPPPPRFGGGLLPTPPLAPTKGPLLMSPQRPHLQPDKGVHNGRQLQVTFVNKRKFQESPQGPNRGSKALKTGTPLLIRPGSTGAVIKNDTQRMAAIKSAKARQLLATPKRPDNSNLIRISQQTRKPSTTAPTAKEKELRKPSVDLGVDDDYKKKLEEQKRLREEIIRKKEESRRQMIEKKAAAKVV